MRSRALTEAVFWGPLLLATVLVAIWPPHTVDGPAHLLGASVLADWDSEPRWRDYYERDLTPTPNLGGNLVLAVLIKLFGLRGGETVLLILCAVGLPLALRAALHVLRPEHGWAAVAALPFGFGYLYFYGFYGFCLGLVLFLCSVAVAIPAIVRPSPWRTVALTAVLTATWFTHLVPFALAIGTVGLLALTSSPVAGRAHPEGVKGAARDRSWMSSRTGALTLAALPMLPGIVLTVAYMARTEQGDGPEWLNPAGLLVGLVSLHSPLVALRQAENFVAAVLAALLVAVGVGTRRVGSGDPAVRGIAWAAGAAALLYLVAPNNLGIDFGLINERLGLFPVLLGLLWLLARPIPPRAVAAVAAGSVLAAGALLGLRAQPMRDIDRLADEYATAENMLSPKSTLLALRLVEFTPDAGRNRHADPVRHLSSRLAARTGGIDVGHYEAVLDYFPARFVNPRFLPGFGPVDLLGQVPPPAAVIQAEEVETGRYAFVLLIGAPQARSRNAVQAVAEIRDRLQKNYVRVGVTAPTGLVEVWRLRSAS